MGQLELLVVDEEMLLGAAHQEYKSGNYKQALQHCTLVHEKSPQRTDALLLLGAIYYQVSWHVSSKWASSDCCIASCGGTASHMSVK